MTRTQRTHIGHQGALALAASLLAVGLVGCFDEPGIEDTWTRIDIDSSNIRPSQVLTGGTTVPIVVNAKLTYRAIRTGFAVAELRASSTVSEASVAVHPEAPRTVMAADIDRILQNSVTMGRSTRAVTGWDHLIQHIDFTFDGHVPAASDSSASTGGLFLLCYLGSGDKVERQDGTDTLIVTPFNSTQYEILPIGMELLIGP
jgi:hypothetical protein